MSFFYQAYLGDSHGRGVTAEEITEALSDGGKPRAIIMGWSKDKRPYLSIREYTRRHGIELWLWFPVLSEHGTERGFEPMTLIDGRSLTASQFDGDEKFDFCCAGGPELPQRLLNIYDRAYSELGFDGVFLDRIRYPSMSAGLEALFGCCCPRCLEWYAAHGMGRSEIITCYNELKERAMDGECPNPLGLERYADGNYKLIFNNLDDFLHLKSLRITETVLAVTERFRDRGLKIGLDLFSPCLAPFVGQDYLKLSVAADFVKPMLYRLTQTPAGIGYEMKAMAGALSGSDVVFNRRLEWLYRFYSTDGTLLTLFGKELEVLSGYEKQTGRRGLFVPGLEIHTTDELPELDAADIRQNVKLAEAAGFHSRVACWNILNASRDNLRAFLGRGD